MSLVDDTFAPVIDPVVADVRAGYIGVAVVVSSVIVIPLAAGACQQTGCSIKISGDTTKEQASWCFSSRLRSAIVCWNLERAVES